MRKLLPLLLILPLAACSNLSQALSTAGEIVGVVAMDLPTACSLLSSELTADAALPGIAGTAAATALNDGNAKYSTYCGPAAQTATDAATAIAAVQAVITDLKNQGL